ncbi:winged helix-turn-helix domain-containing protein [Simiduia agarivorans]|uniref:Transcriptional regulator CadC n=1 Tax=Simiduia agarivorans (strain DSM 21679 / JCM 13881 / BCRC 17597 / SA1) TaxID=1117647 RepID=K4KNQ7_SIMAS|nr:winged helix-turn-helix domain-containing protein [Simiduia agarivorans]AFV00805.1 transcriptional regulator CadC [Simiduia agarivorans SA1 = DSM 21679]
MSASKLPKNEDARSPLKPRQYCFGPFTFHIPSQRLTGPDGPISLDERQAQLLKILLLASPDRVSKEALMQALWPDTIVSEWSLSKLVSETRKSLDDDGNNQSIIRTHRGKGFSISTDVTEVITAFNDTPADAVRSANRSAPAGKQRLFARPLGWLAAVLCCAALLLSYAIRQSDTLVKPFNSHPADTAHVTELMRQIQSQLLITKTAFRAQVNRRNQLGQHLQHRLPEFQSMSWEQRLIAAYPQLNQAETFLWEQIRAQTEGPLYKGNRALLTLIDGHPELLNTLPQFAPLRAHLEVWLAKYHKVFLQYPAMPIVYVGVEDGVPFPSDIDGAVDQWLSENDN